MPTLLWETVPCDEAAVAPLADALGVTRVAARLLCQRGLADPETAARFLAPSLAQLHDPFRLAGMREAADRIEAAVARVLEQGLRTPDIHSEGTTRVGTAEMGDAVVKALRA